MLDSRRVLVATVGTRHLSVLGSDSKTRRKPIFWAHCILTKSKTSQKKESTFIIYIYIYIYIYSTLTGAHHGRLLGLQRPVNTMWRKLLYSGFETCFGHSTQGAEIRYQNTSQIQILATSYFEKNESKYDVDRPLPRHASVLPPAPFHALPASNEARHDKIHGRHISSRRQPRPDPCTDSILEGQQRYLVRCNGGKVFRVYFRNLRRQCSQPLGNWPEDQ